MPAADTIMTKNATGKSGTRIDRQKYDTFKQALLKVIPQTEQGVAFKDLPKKVDRHIPKSMKPQPGSVSWYTTVVKLDLEARGLIERVSNVRPQHVRRVAPAR